MMYVVTHKMFDASLPNGFQRILVGPLARSSVPSNYITDATGDNISNKNTSYCELTALYWIWKNGHDERLGLCHYRRYFEGYHLNPAPCKAYTCERLDGLLRNHDILIARRAYVGAKKGSTVKNGWAYSHHIKDLVVLRQVVEDLKPHSVRAFDTMMDSYYLYPFNMFYATRTVVDTYCSWLFPILFECERRIDISNYDSYQRRVFGFMSERLLGVWMAANDINYRELHVAQIDMPAKNRVLGALAHAEWSMRSAVEGRK